jgi:LPPG:FO 2-phospho-L-lactate transferase
VNAIKGNFVALTGGVGGAKLVLGLSRILDDSQLTAIVNTGDDFWHLSLPICPDLDTLMYTLAGEVNPETGWGYRDETWEYMQALERHGAATWFRIGDQDLATHLLRKQLLRKHSTLTEVTQTLCSQLSIQIQILPMSDKPVRTQVVTDQGRLNFQHYFVRERAEPVVREIEFSGAENATLTPAILAALSDPDLAELGTKPSSAAVSQHYADLLDGFIVDECDREMVSEVEKPGLSVGIYDTIMQSLEDKIRLARETLEFARSIDSGHAEQTIQK